METEIKPSAFIELKTSLIDLTAYKEDRGNFPSNYSSVLFHDNGKFEGLRYSLEFTSYEVQTYLLHKGYSLAVIDGCAHISHGDTDEDMRLRITHVVKELRKRVIAIKSDYPIVARRDLPEYVDSYEMNELDMWNVFVRELKKQLLNG